MFITPILFGTVKSKFNGRILMINIYFLGGSARGETRHFDPNISPSVDIDISCIICVIDI